MSIASALETALSGLRATQAQIQVISGNVANVQTPGYSRETLPQETVVNSVASGVETGAVQRVVDQVLNTNLTNQMTTTSAATTLESYFKQIDALLGQVGSGASINQALDTFSSALQAVATSPQDPVAQGAAVSAGIQSGDVIVQVENTPVTDTQSLGEALASHNPGDTVAVHIYRGSQQMTINVKLGELQAGN